MLLSLPFVFWAALSASAAPLPLSAECASAARYDVLFSACAGDFPLEDLLTQAGFYEEAADVFVSPALILREALCRAGAARDVAPCAALSRLGRDYHHNDDWYPTEKSCRVGFARLELNRALREGRLDAAKSVCRDLVLMDVRGPDEAAAAEFCEGVPGAEGNEARYCARADKLLKRLKVSREQCVLNLKLWRGRAANCSLPGRVDILDEDYCRLTAALRSSARGQGTACSMNPACAAARAGDSSPCRRYRDELKTAFCASLRKIDDPQWLEAARRDPQAAFVETGRYHRVLALPLAEKLAMRRACKR